MWLAVQGRLLTKERMLTLGLQCKNTTCVLCDGVGMESAMHLFSDCVWSTQLWEMLNQWSGTKLQQQDALQSISRIQSRRWSVMKKSIIIAVYGADLYQIWQAKNWKMFRESTVQSNIIVQQIQSVIRERVDMVKNSKRAGKLDT
ncbi:uncharacterized protein LOC142165327 [Nicotiana tabacum]|uniref:Uncharacterized protein LOC142165327 n=1 Tax=Nicotiana tabacum TaxID=4097 RepID=A0AC58S4Y4_TOBAC